MTLSDLLKRAKHADVDKMLIFRDKNDGWSNIDIDIKDNEITITLSNNLIFSSDK